MQLAKILVYIAASIALAMAIADARFLPWANLIIYPSTFLFTLLSRREKRKQAREEGSLLAEDIWFLAYGIIVLILVKLSLDQILR